VNLDRRTSSIATAAWRTVLEITHEPAVVRRCERVISVKDHRILSDGRRQPA
jgi:ABC-type lipoprotein export system ATPase subunit